MTHFHAGDLARFHLQFMEAPLNALLYLQYGALHRAFSEITGERGRGVITCTVTGLPGAPRGMQKPHFPQSRSAEMWRTLSP